MFHKIRLCRISGEKILSIWFSGIRFISKVQENFGISIQTSQILRFHLLVLINTKFWHFMFLQINSGAGYSEDIMCNLH